MKTFRAVRYKVLPTLLFISIFLSAYSASASPNDIHTFAGIGSAGFSGDGGPATAAGLNIPPGVAVDASGNLYIADSNNNRVRMVDANGIITTVAGNGTAGYTSDVPKNRRTKGVLAASAALNGPCGVSVDASGNIFIADTKNNRIRKVDVSGYITTVAGNGTAGYSGDGGQATSAALDSPESVAADSSGNIYIADTNNNCVRKVDASGVITTVAGTGAAGYSGDGGPAKSAQVNHPEFISLDTSGNIYIADTYNNRIRKVSATGTIATSAGAGTPGYSGDGGQALSAGLNYPAGVAVDGAGNVYIADSQNHRVRKVDASGVITTAAGTGTAGYSGDGGPAPAALLDCPTDIAVDSRGNVFVADNAAHRVRMIEGPSYTLPTSTITKPQNSDTLYSKCTISGTASASSGVAFVEVSTNGGSTWGTASGAASFGYSWTPPADGTYYIMSRATDSLGKVETIMSCAVAVVKLDTAAPASAVASPAPGAALTGASATITGTATDGTGSGLTKVEVSTDGGATWNPASGTSNWSYGWGLPAGGGYTIKSRATDNAGNVENPGAGVNVTVSAPVSPVTVTALSPSAPDPASAGTNVTWTAAAAGGSGIYLFQFLRSGPDTGGVSVVTRDWGSANTWTWATTSAMAGDNTVTVNVKNSDGSGAVASAAFLGYTINAISPSTATGQAILMWDPSPSQVAGYKLYIGTQPGVYTQSISVGNVTSYTATNLSYGTTYYFATTAYDLTGKESGYSNEASRTIQHTTTLVWDPSTTTTVTGYKVYFGTQPGVYTQSVDAGGITACSFNNLTYGATYYFTVSAYDASGKTSSYANEVSKTIL